MYASEAYGNNLLRHHNGVAKVNTAVSPYSDTGVVSTRQDGDITVENERRSDDIRETLVNYSLQMS